METHTRTEGREFHVSRGQYAPTGYAFVAAAAFTEVTSYLPGLNMQILSTGAELRTGDVEGLPDALRNLRPGTRSGPQGWGNAVLTDRARNARLMTVSYVVDCDAGGVIVTTP